MDEDAAGFLPQMTVLERVVDDTLKHRHLWEEAGGIFVHHQNVPETLDALSRYFPLKLPAR